MQFSTSAALGQYFFANAFTIRLSMARVTGVLGMAVLATGCSAQQDAPSAAQTTSAPILAVSGERAVGEDWPAFLGPRGDGTSIEKGVDSERWNPHPPIVWMTDLGVSYGAPSVADGRLYQFDRYGVNERLTCYDALTGKELWRKGFRVEYEDMYGYNNGPRCSPIIESDRIYTYGVAGQLSCTNVKTQEVLWTKNLVDDYSVVQNFFGVASTPVLFEDLLLVMVGGSTPENSRLATGNISLARPNGTAIVAFDKMTGEEKYRVGDDLASYASLAIREIGGQPVGLAFLRSGLLGWDPKTGKSLFEYPWRASILESVNASVPVTDKDQILLSECYEVGSVLLSLESGRPKVLWEDPNRRSAQAFRAHWSTPILIDGYLYGCSGRNQPDSDFRCIRISDGEVMWRDRRHERSSVLSVDGYLVVLGEYGLLELIRPTPEKLDIIKSVDLNAILAADGQPILEYPCWAAPVLSHGLLYVRGNKRLVCFDLIPSKK